MQWAPDPEVMQQARQEQRVLVSADTDFGTLLAREGAATPSVILLRLGNGRRAAQISALLLANLDTVRDDLEAGAVVVLDDERIYGPSTSYAWVTDGTSEGEHSRSRDMCGMMSSPTSPKYTICAGHRHVVDPFVNAL